MTKAKNKRFGFTLLESSIVLIIIGLVIGGVILAKDLTKQANNRGLIAQITKYQIALNSFNTKYGALAGDLTPATANSIGLAARAGGPGRGDGNGILQGVSNTGRLYGQSGEISLFWNDMSRVLGGEEYFGRDCDSNRCAATPSTVMPTSKLGDDNYIMAYGDPTTSINYFRIQNFTEVNFYGQYYNSMLGGKAFSGADMFIIDSKMDDGFPFTGKVNAITPDDGALLPSLVTPAAPASGVCVSNIDNSYNYNPATYGNSISCVPRFRF